MQASSGGGASTQAPHCLTAPCTGRAQVWQRARGCANWLTQASHTGSLGQAWQTAQRLGRVGASRAMSVDNTVSIYSWHTHCEP